MEIDHKRHGGQTKQAEQMDSYGKSRDIGYENNPPVTLRTVGLFFPFQNQPKHQGCQKTGEGINLCFDGREPEGVAESIGQCSHCSTAFYTDDIRHGEAFSRRADESLGEVCNGKKQEEDAARTQEGRQEIDHLCHLRRLGGKM